MPAAPARAQDARPRGYLGVSVLPAAEVPAVSAEEGGPYPAALEVAYVVHGAAGERAGIVVGDVILAVDGAKLLRPAAELASWFRAEMSSRHVGDQVELTVLRRAVRKSVTIDGAPHPDPESVVSGLRAALESLPVGGRLEVSAARGRELLRVPVALGPHPNDAPPVRPVLRDADTHARLLEGPSTLESLALETARRGAIEPDTQDLLGRLAALHVTDDGFRTDDVRFLHRHPFRGPELRRDLADALCPRSAGTALAVRLIAAAARDRVDLSASAFAPLPRGVAAEEHAAAIERVMEETVALREPAFAALTADERAWLATNATVVGTSLVESGIYVHADDDLARRARSLRVLELAAKVDRAPLLRAALSWARLADPSWLEALERDLGADPRAGQEVMLRRATPHGEIVIAGRGPHRWRDTEPAVLVDLGGDDLYNQSAGSSSWDARPVAAVLDLAGDDAYEATEDGSQGAGLGGCGLLVDRSGDDTYLAPRWSQAAALLGVGVLIEGGGDDVLRVQHFGQAVASWGVAILVDAGGDDLREGRAHVQAAAMAGGVAVLHDMAGDDRSFAKGGARTGYGTQGCWDAWSQGCAMGYRGLQSGGIAVFVDDAGTDRVEGGHFSQGGGYYFGLGVLEDRGREGDIYVASRYGQGFSAHQAGGLFHDAGGDDRYVTRDGVIAGLAWDESVTCFEDDAGDDTYLAGGFSLGASAHNSVAVFVDRGGRDAYGGTRVGAAGGNDYHGGTSYSLFLDLGPGQDEAEPALPRRGLRVQPQHGLVGDRPGGLDAALDDLLRGRWEPAVP